MNVAGGELSLIVQDDGRGFDPAAPPAADPDRSAGGNGLENLRRRMDEISGTCRIVSRPGQGTVVRFTLPFDLPPASPSAHA
jgi:signal transduction histidine kinase